MIHPVPGPNQTRALAQPQGHHPAAFQDDWWHLSLGSTLCSSFLSFPNMASGRKHNVLHGFLIQLNLTSKNTGKVMCFLNTMPCKS